MTMIAHMILYVKNQEASTKFYAAVLNLKPDLNVPGMTEFRLSETCVLGLMPEGGIKRLLGSALPDPALGSGIPRAELYVRVDEPKAYHERAIENGARKLSGLANRDWGDIAAYSLDPDGHVVAFAKASR